ncbi:GumC family protein [Lichenifustis flavocetrariae]|uniref:CobQ/CobB/MinD/ParA nucleotide binding domain-containing protein n=1 Tax=Lichenifustis flavocetrariae TaxID=2949735 RepID=A0AA42CGT7_9HYPH|nr:division plane positioning ATPase MipZ [Lichenifustis flavocetrariae]MCW6506559.1 hypothetical protein [Lichenifustis flavocetrariae]
MSLTSSLPLRRSIGNDDAVPVLRQIQAFLHRRWLQVGATTLVVVIFAVFALQMLPARFCASAEVLLDPRRDKAFGPDDVAATVTLDTANVESAVALIKGNAVLLRVVQLENLASDPDFNGAHQATNRLWRDLGALLGHKAALPASPEHHAVGALFRALKVDRVGKAYVVSISVTTRDPGKAARLANAVAEGFVRDQRDARLEARRREATFFAERLAPLSEQLRRSEDALDRFRRDHDLTATASSGREADRPSSLNEQQLTELNSRLAASRAETAQAWAAYDGARGTVAHGAMEMIPDVVRSTVVGQLRQQQAEVARKEADLAARYSDSYPTLVDVRAERREIERAIAREMARIVGNLKGVYEIAKSREDGLRAGMTVTTGAAGLDNDLGRQLRELERVKLVDQTVFETYLARAKGAEQQAGFEEHDVRIVSPASEPVVPAFPQTKIVLVCAGLLGLGLGVALGLALDALDQGFPTAHQLEHLTGLPVLASIPWLTRRDRTLDGKILDPARFLVQRPRSPYAEGLLAVRASLAALPVTRSGCVTLVTSSVPGEGKSNLALGLALSATLAGRRVLILDADLRQPSLSRYFGVENRLGFVDMLSGLVGTAETTVPLGPSLAIMPAGRKSASAPDLFGSPRMAIYLDHLRRIYDLIVIDAAPLEAVVDAAVLSRLSDRIVFVVGWRETAKEIVVRSLQRLGSRTKIAGLVLNKVDERKAPHYGRRRTIESHDYAEA